MTRAPIHAPNLALRDASAFGVTALIEGLANFKEEVVVDASEKLGGTSGHFQNVGAAVQFAGNVAEAAGQFGKTVELWRD